jgi:hypothetical protein
MAEGARFELADGLPHLQFSRLARSATPSPLQTKPWPLGAYRRFILLLPNPFHPTQIRLQDFGDED